MTRNNHHPLFWAWLVVLTCVWGQGFAIGEQYVGIGYNLLTANPDGGAAVRGGVDPGLLITRRVLDVSDGRVIREQLRHSCGQVQTTSMFYGAKSYQDKLSAGIQLGGSVFAGLVSAKFALSARYQRTQEQTSQQHQVFQDEQQVCNLGHVRFADELSDWLNVTVTDSFAASVCQLPQEYSQADYLHFIDTWGTHMTTEVDIGTKVIHRSQTSLAEYVRHVVKTSGTDVSLGGSYLGYGASLRINIDSFRSRETFNQSFGSFQETLQVGSESMPEPIRVQLVSIDTALQSKYWEVGNSLTSRGLCDVNFRLAVIANNLRQALTEYAGYKMVHPPTDPPLLVPLTWPRGSYGLAKPTSGCPGGRVTWYSGWRLFVTTALLPLNSFTPNHHLAGYWPSHGDVRMEFCMKGDRVLSDFDVDWPAGDYCVFKYGSCPTGFQDGFVQWDDSYIGNYNSHGGVLPDGVYDYNTKIYFCCRNDDLPTHSVFLPVASPFYLLRHTRDCQHVHGMTLREEVVQWDEPMNFFGFSRDERIGGAHPMDDSTSPNHRLHFCYYYPNQSAASNAQPLVG